MDRFGMVNCRMLWWWAEREAHLDPDVWRLLSGTCHQELYPSLNWLPYEWLSFLGTSLLATTRPYPTLAWVDLPFQAKLYPALPNSESHCPGSLVTEVAHQGLFHFHGSRMVAQGWTRTNHDPPLPPYASLVLMTSLPPGCGLSLTQTEQNGSYSKLL